MMRLLKNDPPVLIHRHGPMHPQKRPPLHRKFCHNEFDGQVAAAFEEKVKLQPATTLPIVDKDICHIEEKKLAALIILTFHKQWKREDGEMVEINLGQG